MIIRDNKTTIWEDRLEALWSHPPPDGGDRFDSDVMGWPACGFYVYEWRSFPYTRSYRYAIPQACSDYQAEILVKNWLTELGYYK